MRKSNFLIIAALIIVFWPNTVFALADILNVRNWTAPEHTRVVIDMSEEVRFAVEKSDRKILLKLTDTALPKSLPREFILNKPGIARIALRSISDADVIFEFYLLEKADSNVFALKKFQDKPHRLVVDIVLPEVEKEKSRVREQIKIAKKDKIVVIDPGHGGEDPGAIGYRGANEKVLVLQISRRVRDLLNAGEGVRAFLTRDEDYYVSFKKRLNVARELGADLFISIHADAAKNRSASGTSVYCLSTGGAVSEAARILAGKENMADIVGGAFGESAGNDESGPILLDMFQTNTINLSKTFGSSVLGKICRINSVKFSRVQEAPFRVLKLPEIPAILVETAYISNPREERRLQSDKFQREIAVVISDAVRGYFSLPAVAAPVSHEENIASASTKQMTKIPLPRTSLYKIRKGDTLNKIAMQCGAEVGSLMRMNKMKLNDPLFVGQMLVVPYSEKEREDENAARKETAGKAPKAKPAVIIYKVKKGDTLDKIAHKHQTSTAALLKMNHIKQHEPLYVDRELKIEAHQAP
jgi:N-acetylmuramoyl-L-alanine amidase